MPKSLKITLALLIAILVTLGFLSLPYIDVLVETCSGSFLCGRHLKQTLDFMSKTDIVALDFGKYLYNKVITGIITFLVILTFSVIAHRIYKKFKD